MITSLKKMFEFGKKGTLVCWFLLIASFSLLANTGFPADTEAPAISDISDASFDFFQYMLDEDSLTQASTIGALMAGLYDGEISIGQLKKNGDFGIGTANALDGELIAMDGQFYHFRSDGILYPMTDDETTPFATVTHFQPEVTYFNVEGLSFEQLEKALIDKVPTTNLAYAFKITGKFSYVQTRVVRKQERPYQRLTEAVKSQAFFEMNDVEGIILGYYVPPYMNGLNITGFHFHFVTNDMKAGGHLVDCMMEIGDVEIDYKYAFKMVLPVTSEFYNADLSVEGLDIVEKPKSNLRNYRRFK